MPAETRWAGTPATVHLSGLDTGALTAHVVDRHMQPSRRLTRKADDLPWSVSSHASSVVTRGRLASGSHGLRWRARKVPFGVSGPGWPGAVSSVADPAGRRSHFRGYGQSARTAPTPGVARLPQTPRNGPRSLFPAIPNAIRCWKSTPRLILLALLGVSEFHVSPRSVGTGLEEPRFPSPC